MVGIWGGWMAGFSAACREWTVCCWSTYPERKRRVVNAKTVRFVSWGEV